MAPLQVREQVVRVRQLRLARGWSQARLAEMSGLSLRTIQRIETGTNPGLESLRSLAAVFEVDVADLQEQRSSAPEGMSFAASVGYCLEHFADFSGEGRRAEFWWFALAVTLAIALANTIGPSAAQAVAVLALLPLLAAAARRLRDAGQSPWWLLLLLAPVGGLVAVGALLALPTRADREIRSMPKQELGPS